ncbi:patatin-like phospholipase family protein [Psychrosphaera ytuae]|uniref:Patatin-like phospholipase family protein n=1 Tax=Psychrosphaera ytuae TaxID=2820710 RepID=A0A975DBP9_9GAMM|nr:patatin-like phospholipase family protein [Psychrosphaera ytuae]QTH63923.1 patatin-like phospholipase family protein [Psychrosphaera ytuae]
MSVQLQSEAIQKPLVNPSMAQEPLALSDIVPGLGLVAEGGGQKGVFTAGVLDSWLVEGFNPFEILVGTSAGAQNIASYLSSQTGFAYSAISHLTMDERFFSLMSGLTGKNALNLDWYFKQVKTPTYQLDLNKAKENAQGRKIRFATTSLEKVQTKLLNPQKSGWLKSLKASSAIPLLYRPGVKIRGKAYIDGGVSAPIPVKEAYKLGADKVVVIRTSKTSDSPITQFIGRTRPVFNKTNWYPRTLTWLDKHEASYDEAQRFIERPPKDLKVVEIYPPRPLRSKLLGSTEDDLIEDYRMGYEVGKQFILNRETLL